MMWKTCLLVISLTRLSLSEWFCGGVLLSGSKKCKCANETLTLYKDDMWRGCCGPDTCFIDHNGDGVCPDGVPCDTDDFYEDKDFLYSIWRCGDILIQMGQTCQCGSTLLEFWKDNWSTGNFFNVWCCPSEPGLCTYQEDGSAVCPNATVIDGIDKGCDSGVCSSRLWAPCKSGNQCVQKKNLCQDQPLCDDGSDVDLCNSQENEDLCPPSADWMKCSSNNKCFSKYDICRGDPVCSDGSDANLCSVNYESINECITDEYNNGLMCGWRCLDTWRWCDPDTAASCVTNTTIFRSDNQILCQNETFWDTVTTSTSHIVKHPDDDQRVAEAWDEYDGPENAQSKTIGSKLWLWQQLEKVIGVCKNLFIPYLS